MDGSRWNRNLQMMSSRGGHHQSMQLPRAALAVASLPWANFQDPFGEKSLTALLNGAKFGIRVAIESRPFGPLGLNALGLKASGAYGVGACLAFSASSSSSRRGPL